MNMSQYLSNKENAERLIVQADRRLYKHIYEFMADIYIILKDSPNDDLLLLSEELSDAVRIMMKTPVTTEDGIAARKEIERICTRFAQRWSEIPVTGPVTGEDQLRPVARKSGTR